MFKKNNKLNKDENKFMNNIFLLFGLLIILGGLLGMLFKSFDKGNELTIVNALEYTGSFGGAILGAGTSFVILSITSIRQKKDLEEQRELDQKAREEEKERFERSHNLQLINDKLLTYKETYILSNRLISEMYELCNILNDREMFDNEEFKIKIDNVQELLKRFEFQCMIIHEDTLNLKHSEISEICNEFASEVFRYSLFKTKKDLLMRFNDTIESIEEINDSLINSAKAISLNK